MSADSNARRWPLTTQLTLALIFGVLAPIAAVVWINARDVERQSLTRETVALEHRAAEAARRLEERVGRLRAYVEHVATNPSILRAVGGAPGNDGDVLLRAQAWDEQHPEIHDLLVSVRDANPWFRNVYLLSEAGVCISSSERGKTPEMVGRVYDYRPYFRAPIDNAAPFVSDVLKNANSPGTGIFVSAPILANGEVLAVAVLKVDSFALHDIVADLSQRAGRSLLVDRFGVVVSDATDGHVQTVEKETSLQFRPLADVSRYVPRFEETKRYGDTRGDNYLARIAQPLELSSLWADLRTQATGASEFEFPSAADGSFAPTMVGYSPVWSLSSEPYGYVVLAENSATFREPLLELGRDALIRFGVITALILIAALLLLGRLSRRVQTLRKAAAAASDPLGGADSSVPAASAPARRALVDRLLRLVRAPLASAQGTLTRVESGDADLGEALDGVRAQVAESLNELDGTLLLAPGEPVIAMQRQRTSLEPLLERLVEEARPAAELHDTTVSLDAANTGEITTDPRKLALLLGNLLANACQYTRRGTVKVEAKRDDDGVEIAIVDTGIGMTRRQLERIVDPFADEVGSETPKLGVVIAVRTADLLGGSLELSSDPDKGTVARLRLPIR
ncbi:MAG: ATP-binding protein [Myxococcota bacterium]